MSYETTTPGPRASEEYPVRVDQLGSPASVLTGLVEIETAPLGSLQPKTMYAPAFLELLQADEA